MLARRLAYSGPPGLGYWAWLLDGEVVGLGHLQPARDLPAELIETGWCVKPALWCRGLAAEAVQALLDYALRDLGLPAVWALVSTRNAPSAALAGRLGFLRVGGMHADRGPADVYVSLPGIPGAVRLRQGAVASRLTARRARARRALVIARPSLATMNRWTSTTTVSTVLRKSSA